MLHHLARDPFYLRDPYHKSMKTTKKYVDIYAKSYKFGNNEFRIKVTSNKRKQRYLKQGFERVDVKDSLIFLSKRK